MSLTDLEREQLTRAIALRTKDSDVEAVVVEIIAARDVAWSEDYRRVVCEFRDRLAAVEADRDRLAERLAAVEALADEWERDSDEVMTLGWATDRLRAALSTLPTAADE